MGFSRDRGRGRLRNLVSLIGSGGLAGLLVAALAFPVVAVGGVAARSGAEAFDGLPSDLRMLPLPQTTTVYASDGKTLLARFYDEHRRDVPITDVAVVMRQAMVAAEDARFYEHNGVDLKAVARAFVNNQRGGDLQGASTLTMQYVRQALAYAADTPAEVVAATEDTTERKLAEMRRAITLESTLTKEQILERYLNITPFGNGAYGIHAASQVYFGKPPAQLALGEAALLAAVPQAPGYYDLTDPQRLSAALARRDGYVLPQMVALGHITQADADRVGAARAPKIVGKRPAEGCVQTVTSELGAGFYCDYLRRWWMEQEAFGPDGYARLNALRTGGYRIVTALDVQTQTAAATNIRRVMAAKDEPHRAMMLAAVEPGSGHVRALSVNRLFSNDQSGNGPHTDPKKAGQRGNYPNTTVPLLTGGGEVHGYQAGSVLKVFTVAAALERGIPLDHTINTVSPYRSGYPVDPDSPAACEDVPRYCPENYTRKSMGRRTMWTGLGSSVNTYFVPLQEKIGTTHVVDVARRLGVRFHTEEDRALAAAAKTWGAFTLGVSAHTPLELANAFATLAADGVYCDPTPVQQVHDRHGSPVGGIGPACRQVIEPDVARGTVDAARCPVGDRSAFDRCGGATAGDTRRIVGRPVFGKTGTTDDEKSASLVVSTRQLAIAGFYADPDWPQTRERFEHRGGVNPVVQRALRDATAGKPLMGFPPPSRSIAFGH